MNINNVSLQLGSSAHVQPRSQAPIKGDSPSTSEQTNSTSLADAQKNTPSFKISRSFTPGIEPTREERLASSLRSLEIFIRELPKETEALNDRVDTLESILAKKVPSTIEKNWDFSINEDGSASVIGNELSESEREKIASIIDSSGIGKDLSSVRDLMVEALEQDRGVGLYSTNIGKYDLTEQNFSEIIYFKEYLSEANKSSAGESLAAQLNARANEVYNKKETVDVYV